MLCTCIHAVSRGQIWARSEQLRFIIQEATANGEARPIRNAIGTELLTKREEELAQLVAEGLTNRDISKRLNLTEHTVRNYLFRIFNKLGTSNRLELALYVIKQRGEHGTTSFLSGPGTGPSDVQSPATPAPKLMGESRKIEVPAVRTHLKLETPRRTDSC
jgi:DNA-binding CsgD family transcriptional regulator